MTVDINPYEAPKASLEVPLSADPAPALWNPDAAGHSALMPAAFRQVRFAPMQHRARHAREKSGRRAVS
jgi:hypothetical protein